jgi:DNA-binding MurR/RpiR family transcriptional regulator
MTDNKRGGVQTDVRQLIRAHLRSFSPAERRVADVVLAGSLELLETSVTELAERANTSAASVVRMCTSIGLRGFQELKTRLAIEHVPAAHFDAGPVGDGAELAVRILRDFASALKDTAAVLDVGSVSGVVGELLAARRIHFAAVGTSAMIASDCAFRLSTLGLNVLFVADVHAQHIQARMLGDGDVLFAISHTGSTFETLAAARAAKSAGASVMALTSFTRSPLTELCDHTIIAGSAETKVRVEAVTSRLVHLAVLDALYIMLKQQLPDADRHLRAASEVLAEHRF